MNVSYEAYTLPLPPSNLEGELITTANGEWMCKKTNGTPYFGKVGVMVWPLALFFVTLHHLDIQATTPLDGGGATADQQQLCQRVHQQPPWPVVLAVCQHLPRAPCPGTDAPTARHEDRHHCHGIGLQHRGIILPQLQGRRRHDTPRVDRIPIAGPNGANWQKRLSFP